MRESLKGPFNALSLILALLGTLEMLKILNCETHKVLLTLSFLNLIEDATPRALN